MCFRIFELLCEFFDGVGGVCRGGDVVGLLDIEVDDRIVDGVGGEEVEDVVFVLGVGVGEVGVEVGGKVDDLVVGVGVVVVVVD